VEYGEAGGLACAKLLLKSAGAKMIPKITRNEYIFNPFRGMRFFIG